MHVHFVCVGNSYRSRLAEALLAAKQLANVSVSSSGVRADEDVNGPVSWQALRLLKNAGLIPFMSRHWMQTSAAMLGSADLVVFMEAAVQAVCAEQYALGSRPHEIWEIPDAGYPYWQGQFDQLSGETRSFAINEATLQMLRERVDDLARRLA